MSEGALEQLRLFFSRRSIRRFKRKQVSERVVRGIVEAGQRAPTACNLQTYTVVWVRDAEQRKRVLEACEVRSSIREAPVVFVVCADVRRLAKVLDCLDYDHCLKHGYGYSLKLFSIVDASLMAENMTLAAECYGLGSVFIGSALANEKLIEVLNVPKGVLPLTLLCVGYPDEQPPTRPRWALSSVLQTDQYRDPTVEEVESFLKHMNLQLEREGYYKENTRRRRSYKYTDHIKVKTALKRYKQEDTEILIVMKKTGFFPGESV